jgi:hypothetical protein
VSSERNHQIKEQKEVAWELDLVINADGQAVQTVIRGFSLWQRLRCVVLVKPDFIFLQMWPFFRKFCFPHVK